MKKQTGRKKYYWGGGKNSYWEQVEHVMGTDQKIWRKRTIALRKLIKEEDQSVLDIGAGEMYLKKILPDGVRYYPLDYIRRHEETLVYDLNRKEFPDITADTAVCAGIIEYIEDVPWFFDRLVQCAKTIVLSYRSREGGYDNSVYTSDEIINMLNARGFLLTGWNTALNKEWPLLARFEKASPKLLAQNWFCTGCGACVNKCAAEALILQPDGRGFLKPVLDTQKCTDCGVCVQVCPAAKPVYKSDEAQEDCACYAAWAEDGIRLDSSSGGAFTVFAQNVIKRQGIVYGVQYTKDFYVQHTGTDSIAGLEKMRHSKYVQSNTEKTYREAERRLAQGKWVLYTGTPCQTAGLKAFLGRDYDRLILVDLVCFCVTPVTAFRKYLEECYGIADISDVVFRDKYRGWKSDGYSVRKKDGTVLRPDGSTDCFQKAFHAVLCRNQTCDMCRYAAFPREADLTIGDFWGIEFQDASWNDGKGTSLILANTVKGRQFLESVSGQFQRLEQVLLKWCRGMGNRIGNDGRARHAAADRFLDLLRKQKFEETVEEVLENRHDIGMVCLLNHNYGNNLTNMALYRILNDLGYSVLITGYPQDAKWKPYEDKWKLFAQVPYEQTDIAQDYMDKISLKELNGTCRMFLVASDQLFRGDFVEGMDFHACLDWVSSDKYKMSYAASFGMDEFHGTQDLKKKMQYYLSRFQALSVREESGTGILKREFGLQGKTVMDPVFLCDRKYYTEMAKYGRLRLPECPYVGGYILDTSEEKEAVVRAVQKYRDVSEYRMISDAEIADQAARSQWNLEIMTEAVVEEWLANVLYSDFFVTDSFHGMCFALILNKDFLVVMKKDSWRGMARIKSLLGMLKLEERLVESAEDLEESVVRHPVDYASVNKRLEQMSEDSRQWLVRQLRLGMRYKGKIGVSDVLDQRIDQNTGSICELKGRVAEMDHRQLQMQEQNDRNMQQERELLNRVISMMEEQRNLLHTGKAQEARIRKLEEQTGSLLQERRRLEQELRSVYASNSWKLTGVFRKVKTSFTDFRNRAGR